jgi:pimeloyl-ACP methyl ester carboxylesterase
MKLAWLVEKPVEGKQAKPLADVVLLHGTGSNSHMWERQSQFLAIHGYRSFLIDLRGHGNSPDLREPCPLDQHAADVLETILAAGVEIPAYFVGHSLGSIIAVTLAAKKPELVKAIFAASLPGKVLPPLPLALRGFVRGPMQLVRSTGLHKYFAWRERTLFEMDAQVLDQIAQHFGSINLVDQPLPVNCPVHFANGVWDPVAPYRHVLTMHRLLPGSTLKTFKLGGHNFMDAETASVNSWLLEHLSPLTRESASGPRIPNFS